jgi:threonine/homoserine/homoserine lactone efflux protein
MTFEYFLKGLLIGFSIAAPVGPIGVLTIKRTLTEGRMSGFVTGLGAAFADTVYGSVAGFGLTAISSFLLAQQLWLKLGGGFFLLYLGISSFFKKPKSEVVREDMDHGNGYIGNLVSTFLLTLTNPTTILSFIAIFAGLGLGAVNTAQNGYQSSLALVLGVFIGSALWWLILSYVISIFKSKINEAGLIWINRISGIVIVSFGIWALLSVF